MVENLIINRVVLHQIFIRNDDKSIKQPKYNDTLTQMDDTSSFIFSQRVVQAIGNESHCIEMEIYKSDESSTFKNLIDLIDKDDEKFIDLSKKIAYKLAESQTSKKIPGGTVVIFEGTVGNDEKNFIAVMKAEYQSGFQLNTSSNGLSLDFIKNLILTPHQKFYKIGFFIENESNKTDYIALVYDNNLSKGSSSEAAQYFYDEFLGCKFKQTDKHLTKKFYIHTKEFINNLIDLTETEKIDLNYALYSYVKLNQTNMISTKNFADTYMKDKFKDEYTGYMEENDFPERNIFKDISLISSDLKNRKIKFNNNINLTAPSDKFKDYIKFEENDADDLTIIKIKGKILSQQ